VRRSVAVRVRDRDPDMGQAADTADLHGSGQRPCSGGRGTPTQHRYGGYASYSGRLGREKLREHSLFPFVDVPRGAYRCPNAGSGREGGHHLVLNGPAAGRSRRLCRLDQHGQVLQPGRSVLWDDPSGEKPVCCARVEWQPVHLGSLIVCGVHSVKVPRSQIFARCRNARCCRTFTDPDCRP